MVTNEHPYHSPHRPHHGSDRQHEGHERDHHNSSIDRMELYGGHRECAPARYARNAHEDQHSIVFTNPFENTAQRAAGSPERTRARDAEHERQLTASEARIEHSLRQNPHNFAPVYRELDGLRQRDGANIAKDLEHINNTMHERGLLRGQQIIRNDRVNEPGWGVVADDKEIKERYGHRDQAMVSTSHPVPHESDQLRRSYSRMHHRGHNYNGWNHSVEGGGGAHGGFDSHSVGARVPEDMRRPLIEEALRLADMPVTEQNIAAVNTIVSRESSWLYNRTNTWDSNARAGHPSTGLMQTIPSTFERYALPGYNNNINDPLSNLVAGIRYAESRYRRQGGLVFVASRPGGY